MVKQDGIHIIGAREIIVQRRRVKRARIMVDEDLRVRVTLPFQCSQEQVEALIERKARWIQKQLAFFRGRRDGRTRLGPHEILYLGETYTFRWQPELRRTVSTNPRRKVIASGIDLLADGALDRWYRKEARRIITERLTYFADRHGFTYNRVFIRDQKTLWGSCSSRGNLSFNWRLIQTPPDIIDYLVVHELVHTRILRHTREFWSTVASLCPHYQQARTWLKHFHPAH